MSIIAIAASSSAFAIAVGDNAVLNCTASQGGMSVPFTMTNEVTSIDEATDTINVTTNTAVQGQVQSQSQASKLSDYRNLEVASANVELICPSMGELTTVATPVGTFTACKTASNINGSPASIYIANVPFSLVKLETNDGTISCTLQSYKKN